MLKIISLNLAGFKDWELREQRIVDYIAGENPDVILLQEVKYDARKSAYGQSMVLNRLLPTPFPFSQTTISKFYQPSHGDAYREGLAVLSKFPIVSSEVLVLTKQPDDKHTRIVQNIDIEVDGQMVLLSNIHLSNNAYSVDQLAELMTLLKSRNEKRIIAGDFNVFHLEDVRDIYAEDYTASVEFKKYVSFPSEDRTLDYVLTPKETSFVSLDTQEGLSDHSALSFMVELP